jgi:hypothetical protein
VPITFPLYRGQGFEEWERRVLAVPGAPERVAEMEERLRKIVYAPWEVWYITNLNRYQVSGEFHPFTCINHSHQPLVALRSGWYCLDCNYTQWWAYEWMVRGDW